MANEIVQFVGHHGAPSTPSGRYLRDSQLRDDLPLILQLETRRFLWPKHLCTKSGLGPFESQLEFQGMVMPELRVFRRNVPSISEV